MHELAVSAPVGNHPFFRYSFTALFYWIFFNKKVKLIKQAETKK